MSILLTISQFVGPKPAQEDSFVAIPIPGSREILVAVVLDGVSQTRDGRLAAHQAGASFLASVLRSATRTDFRQVMETALLEANGAVLRLHRDLAYYSIPQHELPACVGTFVLCDDRHAFVVGHVGDSAALLQAQDKLIPLTKPYHDAAGALTRYFGMETFEYDILSGLIDPHESLHIMTDGALEALAQQQPIPDPTEFFSQAHNSVFADNATAIRLSFGPSIVAATPPTPEPAQPRVEPVHIDVTA